MSQNSDILAYMRSGHEITTMDAIDLFKCTRLARVIGDLKGDGYPVLDRWVDLPSGKRVKAYRLGACQQELFRGAEI